MHKGGGVKVAPRDGFEPPTSRLKVSETAAYGVTMMKNLKTFSAALSG